MIAVSGLLGLLSGKTEGGTDAGIRKLVGGIKRD